MVKKKKIENEGQVPRFMAQRYTACLQLYNSPWLYNNNVVSAVVSCLHPLYFANLNRTLYRTSVVACIFKWATRETSSTNREYFKRKMLSGVASSRLLALCLLRSLSVLITVVPYYLDV